MIERMTVDEWLEFDRARPAPTFFARPAWALALTQAYTNMEPAPLRIHTRDATIVLPLMQMSGGTLGWREFCGFPLGAYTCFLLEDGKLASTQQCDAAIAELGKAADTARIVPWPLGPAPTAGLATQHETGVIDLSNGIDAALNGVEGIFRRMAGQAQRRGVICERAHDERAADVYYAILEASAARWGLDRPGIPKALVTALIEHGGDDVQVWFAKADGREIAGGVVFYGSEELFFWSAAMLSEHSRLRPSNLLNFALMRAAADRGKHWYNLGSSEGLPGVARFKREMGAREVLYKDVHVARARFKIYSSVRRVFRTRASA